MSLKHSLYISQNQEDKTHSEQLQQRCQDNYRSEFASIIIYDGLMKMEDTTCMCIANNTYVQNFSLRT